MQIVMRKQRFLKRRLMDGRTDGRTDRRIEWTVLRSEGINIPPNTPRHWSKSPSLPEVQGPECISGAVLWSSDRKSRLVEQTLIQGELSALRRGNHRAQLHRLNSHGLTV